MDETIAACQGALRLRPDFLNTRVLLGNAFAAKGQVAEANAEYLQVWAQDPNHAGALAARKALEGRR